MSYKIIKERKRTVSKKDLVILLKQLQRKENENKRVNQRV